MVEYAQKCRACVGPQVVALADAARYEAASRRALLPTKDHTEKPDRERNAAIYLLRAAAARARAETAAPAKTTCLVCGGTGTITGNGSAEVGGATGFKTPIGERFG
jgi:hypothetical protein